MEVKKKIEKLLNIYNQYKKRAIVALEKGEYEFALGMTSAIADLMYQLNIIYTDKDLESLISKCSVQYIKAASVIIPDNLTVMFYDEFGFDIRGLAMLYLKALREGGYHVIYITRSYRKGKIKRIEELLVKDAQSKILFLDRGLYKEETESILEYVIKYSVSAVFIYSMPQGIVGPLVSNKLKGTRVITYKINLTDHAFWLGSEATDYFIEFRNEGASISKYKRGIPENKLILLPYLPEIDENIEFQGFPFDVKGKKIIFSGGALYKTFSEDNLYYQIVEGLLKRYDDIVFWYAGSGDTSRLAKLQKKYPGKLYYTEEREDLYQVLKHCYFYLSTYPLNGGLMSQYAVVAGKIPYSLIKYDICTLVLLQPERLNCTFDTVEDLLKHIDYAMKDYGYLKKLEVETANQVLCFEDFCEELNSIILNQKTSIKCEFKLMNMEEGIKLYIQQFSEENLYHLLYTKRTKVYLDRENKKKGHSILENLEARRET